MKSTRYSTKITIEKAEKYLKIWQRKTIGQVLARVLALLAWYWQRSFLRELTENLWTRLLETYAYCKVTKYDFSNLNKLNHKILVILFILKLYARINVYKLVKTVLPFFNQSSRAFAHMVFPTLFFPLNFS